MGMIKIMYDFKKDFLKISSRRLLIIIIVC